MILNKKVNIILSFAIALLILSCNNNPKSYIPKITGYWEIESVKLEDGTTKEYTFSDTIDYIEINDSLSGFRKKLKPNLKGEYKTSNDTENIKIVIENNVLYLYYSTKFDQWKEVVLNANDTHLIIENENHNIYTYKRYKPIEIE